MIQMIINIVIPLKAVMYMWHRLISLSCIAILLDDILLCDSSMDCMYRTVPIAIVLCIFRLIVWLIWVSFFFWSRLVHFLVLLSVGLLGRMHENPYLQKAYKCYDTDIKTKLFRINIPNLQNMFNLPLHS